MPGLSFKTHPNINKELFNSKQIIGLKDPNRPFPTGQNDVGLMKWRMQKMDESSLPLTGPFFLFSFFIDLFHYLCKRVSWA